MPSNLLNMRVLTGLFLFWALQVGAQWRSFELSPRGDTLNRVDLLGKRQGPWFITVPELRGERAYEEQGHFVDNQKDGGWMKFSPEGILIAEEQYRWGLLNGLQKYYTPFGGLVRTESWRALDPKNPFDTVLVYDLNDPNKIVGSVVVKNEGASFRHGTFTYYDPRTGKVEERIEYVMNRLKEELGGTGGTTLQVMDPRAKPAYSPTVDSLGNKKVGKPPQVQQHEKKNSGKKSVRVRDGTTSGN